MADSTRRNLSGAARAGGSFPSEKLLQRHGNGTLIDLCTQTTYSENYLSPVPSRSSYGQSVTQCNRVVHHARLPRCYGGGTDRVERQTVHIAGEESVIVYIDRPCFQRFNRSRGPRTYASLNAIIFSVFLSYRTIPVPRTGTEMVPYDRVIACQ